MLKAKLNPGQVCPPEQIKFYSLYDWLEAHRRHTAAFVIGQCVNQSPP